MAKGDQIVPWRLVLGFMAVVALVLLGAFIHEDTRRVVRGVLRLPKDPEKKQGAAASGGMVGDWTTRSIPWSQIVVMPNELTTEANRLLFPGFAGTVAVDSIVSTMPATKLHSRFMGRVSASI